MLRTFISIELVKSQSNYSLRQLACPPRSRSSDPFHTLRKHQVVVGQKSGCLNCSFLPHFVEAYLPWSICKKVGFFLCTVQRRRSQHAHTLTPYEHTYANPTPMSTSEGLDRQIWRFPKSPLVPRCRRERRLPINA